MSSRAYFHQQIATPHIRVILDEMAIQGAAAGVPVATAEAAGLLYALARLRAPARILELGTGQGYTALVLALASPAARLITIELSDENCRAAHTYFDAAGCSGRIEVIHGDATSLLPDVSGPFDMLFLDVDKEHYPEYLVSCVPLLAQGAVVVADDVFFDGCMPDGTWLSAEKCQMITTALDEFGRLTRQVPGLFSLVLPLGPGLMIGIYQPTEGMVRTTPRSGPEIFERKS